MNVIIPFILGLVIMFMIAFALSGFLFKRQKPLPRAIYTTLAAWLCCSLLAGYFLGGWTRMDIFISVFGRMTALYIIPAAIIFVYLRLSFQKKWDKGSAGNTVEDVFE